jgi:hypothetical protein
MFITPPIDWIRDRDLDQSELVEEPEEFLRRVKCPVRTAVPVIRLVRESNVVMRRSLVAPRVA